MVLDGAPSYKDMMMKARLKDNGGSRYFQGGPVNARPNLRSIRGAVPSKARRARRVGRDFMRGPALAPVLIASMHGDLCVFMMWIWSMQFNRTWITYPRSVCAVRGTHA